MTVSSRRAAPSFVLPNWESAHPVRRVTGTQPLQLPPIDLVVPRFLGSLGGFLQDFASRFSI